MPKELAYRLTAPVLWLGFDNSKELDTLVNILKKACDQTDIPSETVFFVSTRSDTVTWHDAEEFPKDKNLGRIYQS